MLSKQQIAAAHSDASKTLVIAGAGTGKTTTIIERIRHLIEDRNVPQEKIVAITFTRMAAKEINTRTGYGKINAGTIHSFCYKQVLKYSYKQKISFLDESDSTKLFTEIFYDNLYKACPSLDNILDANQVNKKNFYQQIEKSIFSFYSYLYCLLGYIPPLKELNFPGEIIYDSIPMQNSYIKRLDGTSLQELVNPTIPPLAQDLSNFSTFKQSVCVKTYNDYFSELLLHKTLSYDFIIALFYVLLKTDVSYLQYFQHQYPYFLVDEFQDVDIIQYKIFSTYVKDLFVVGDDDQSIYGFRGSFPNIFQVFNNEHHPKTYILDENYRSADKILSLANQIISNNTIRIAKNLRPVKNFIEKPMVYNFNFKCYSSQDLYLSLINIVKGLLDLGIKGREIAILTRTNAEIKQISNAFSMEGIPYIAYKHTSLNKKHVRSFMTFLQLIDNVNNNILFSIALESYVISSKTKTLALLQEISQKYNTPIHTILSQLLNNQNVPYADSLKKLRALPRVLAFVSFFNELLTEKKDIPQDTYNIVLWIWDQLCSSGFINREQIDTVNTYFMPVFRNVIAKYEFSSIQEVISYFLSNPKDELSEGMVEEEASIKDDYINILTIHGAKGLEFHTVILPSLWTGNFPVGSFDEGLEDERRLLYVAITRAKCNFFAIAPSGWVLIHNHEKQVEPSIFYDEIKNVLENMKESK